MGVVHWRKWVLTLSGSVPQNTEHLEMWMITPSEVINTLLSWFCFCLYGFSCTVTGDCGAPFRALPNMCRTLWIKSTLLVYKSLMTSLQNYSPKCDDNGPAMYFTCMFPVIQPVCSAARKSFVRKFMKIAKPIMELRDLVPLTLVDKVPVYAKVFELMTAN